MSEKDKAAVLSVLEGDRNRYEELIRRHQRMVYAIAWSHLGDVDLAEDAAQEAFLKGYCHLPSLRHPGKFKGWLARIVRNICASRQRQILKDRDMLRQWKIENPASKSPSTDSRETLEETLCQSLAGMAPIHREALTLFYLEQKSVREAAEILSISEQAMRTRLHRARNVLRGDMERRLEEALGRMAPRRDMARPVMSLLPVAPSSVAGVGGLLLKWLSGISFYLWMTLGQVAVFGLLMRWITGLFAKNIREGEQHRFRKSILKSNMVFVVLMIALVLFLTRVFARRFGTSFIFIAIAFVLSWNIRNILRYLRLNRSPFVWGQLISTSLMWVASVLIGFFGAPYYVFMTAIVLLNVVLFFTYRDMPMRMDYNLFLRQATGGLGDVLHADERESPVVSPSQMEGFAKFLGENWLLGEYKIRQDKLVLYLPVVGLGSLNLLSMLSGRAYGGSRIIVDAQGNCEAGVNRADLRGIRKSTGRDVREKELREGVERAMQASLALFLSGDRERALYVLQSKPDKEVFKREFKRTRGYKLMFAVAIGCGLLGLVLGVLSGVF